MNIWPTEEIDIDLLDPSDENPNEMTDDEFSALVEEVADHGWLTPLQVIGPGPNGRYKLFGGHHRVKVAEVLGMTRLPCVVVDPDAFDDDFRKLQLVRQNILHGSLNPEKFTRLYNEMAKRYDGEVLRRMFAFTKTDAFDRLYLDAKKALPPDMQRKLEDVRKELKTVDDLSLVLNRLFTEYGNTLDSNFMFFSWGGKEHIMIQLSAPGAWQRVSVFARWCVQEKVKIDEELMTRMEWPQM